MRIIVLVICMMLSSAVSAAYQCSVSVNRILIYNNGNVNVMHSGRNDYTIICNLKEPRQDVSITTCAMWASMLQNIKKNGGTAQFYYSGDATCSTLPTYDLAPVPVYIGDL